MTLDRFDEYDSVSAAASALAPKLDVGVEALRRWVLQAQTDAGAKVGPSGAVLDEIRQLKQENRDLTEAKEFLKKDSIFFARERGLVATDLSLHRGEAGGRPWSRANLAGPAGAGLGSFSTVVSGLAHPPGIGSRHR